MDLEAARKALRKRSALSPRRIAFFAVATLALLVGILSRVGQQSTPIVVAPASPPTAVTPTVRETTSVPDAEQGASAAIAQSQTSSVSAPAAETTPAKLPASPVAEKPVTAPTKQPEPTGKAADEPAPATEPYPGQPDLSDSSVILVSRRPVQVLASPSPSATALYGFPAGRPFRVIDHQSGYVHIQDLKSSANGWIEEAALVQPPPTPAQPNGVSSAGNSADLPAGQKPAATQNTAVTGDSELATKPVRKRPGLFGGGGLFGRIFGNGN